MNSIQIAWVWVCDLIKASGSLAFFNNEQCITLELNVVLSWI